MHALCIILIDTKVYQTLIRIQSFYGHTVSLYKQTTKGNF